MSLLGLPSRYIRLSSASPSCFGCDSLPSAGCNGRPGDAAKDVANPEHSIGPTAAKTVPNQASERSSRRASLEQLFPRAEAGAMLALAGAAVALPSTPQPVPTALQPGQTVLQPSPSPSPTNGTDPVKAAFEGEGFLGHLFDTRNIDKWISGSEPWFPIHRDTAVGAALRRPCTASL